MPLLIPVLLAGCSSSFLPTSSHPSCSWTESPPQNATALCSLAFRTMSELVRAEVKGDTRTIARLVPNRIVAARVIAHSRALRRDHVLWLHVTPSLTLGSTPRGELAVALNIVGATRAGKVKAPQQVVVRLQGGHAYVVGDQPGQEW